MRWNRRWGGTTGRRSPTRTPATSLAWAGVAAESLAIIGGAVVGFEQACVTFIAIVVDVVFGGGPRIVGGRLEPRSAAEGDGRGDVVRERWGVDLVRRMGGGEGGDQGGEGAVEEEHRGRWRGSIEGMDGRDWES